MSVVEIPVLGHVAPTQLVLLLNMPQCVTVRWDTLVIHSQDAHKFSKVSSLLRCDYLKLRV